MDDYNTKYHKYDQVREDLSKPTIIQLQHENNKLKSQIKYMERKAYIDIQYAKEMARKRAYKMI